VVLLPNITVPNFFVSTPSDIEIRGWVTLTLLCVFKNFVQLVPQEGAPARVLLNAEHRSTYLPPGWPATAKGDLDFDQTGTNIILASGKALNEIPQEPCLIFRAPLANAKAVLERVPSIGATASELDDVDAAAALVGGLARLGPDPAALEVFNRILAEGGLSARLAPAARSDDRK
jgi:hypothetical protein